MKRLIALLIFLSLSVPAAAQWQVPVGAVPIGRGAGVVGFNSASGASGLCLVSTGLTTAPTFQTCGGIPATSFGVKCDGATNDTASIVAAFAGTAGKNLIFPPGVCITDPMSITATLNNIPQSIYAYGTTFKARASSASPLLTIENPHTILNGFAIYGAIFDANSLHGYPLKIHGGQFMYLRDIQALNGATGGMWLAAETSFGIYSSLFQNVRIRGNAGAGFIAKSTNNAGNYLVDANNFDHIDSQNNGTFGADLDFVNMAFYGGSLFQGNGTCGLNVDHVLQLDLYGAHVEANPNNSPGCAITSTANSLNVKVHGGREIGTITAGLLTSAGTTVNTSQADPTIPVTYFGAVHFTATGPSIPTGLGLGFGGTTAVDTAINSPATGLAFMTSGNQKWSYQNGFQIGAPTGGDKGLGTINAATDYYKNGTIIPETVAAPITLSAGGQVGCATCVTATKTLLAAASSNSLNQNTTGFFWNNQCAATEAQCQVPLDSAGTIQSATFTSNSAPAAGQTYIFTLRKNGSNTSITCTISNPATKCSDAAHATTYSAGDLLSVQVALSATAGNNSFALGLTLTSP